MLCGAGCVLGEESGLEQVQGRASAVLRGLESMAGLRRLRACLACGVKAERECDGCL